MNRWTFLNFILNIFSFFVSYARHNSKEFIFLFFKTVYSALVLIYIFHLRPTNQITLLTFFSLYLSPVSYPPPKKKSILGACRLLILASMFTTNESTHTRRRRRKTGKESTATPKRWTKRTVNAIIAGHHSFNGF